MDDVKKGWILGGILLIVIVIAFSFGIFWKNNPESVSEYFESVVDSVKEIIGMEDSEPLNDNVESNNKPNETANSSSEVTSISGGGGGGGGGGGVARRYQYFQDREQGCFFYGFGESR